MLSLPIRLALATTIVLWPVKVAIAQSADTQARAVIETDPNDLSEGFWTDWNEFKASPDVSALTKEMGGADKATATIEAAATTRTQPVVPIGIDRPEEAARLLDAAAASLNDQVTKDALATVLTMRIAPETREAAMPLVAPDLRARVESWNANLTTGIQGLPGIYLSWNEQASGGEMPSVPAGYAPVAGGSMGCRPR